MLCERYRVRRSGVKNNPVRRCVFARWGGGDEAFAALCERYHVRQSGVKNNPVRCCVCTRWGRGRGVCYVMRTLLCPSNQYKRRTPQGVTTRLVSLMGRGVFTLIQCKKTQGVASVPVGESGKGQYLGKRECYICDFFDVLCFCVTKFMLKRMIKLCKTMLL